MAEEQENVGAWSIDITTPIDKYSIDAKDIVRIYFIEDIFSFSMTGKIEFYDQRGLFEVGPITGTEVITITYGGAEKITKYFHVYKVVKCTPMTQAMASKMFYVELLFVDFNFHKLHTKSHSLSFSNIKYTDIIKTIADKHCSITDFEKFEAGKEKIEAYYTGMRTPAEDIKWLMNRCSSAKLGVPGYVFFNSTTKKGWHFCTMESLLSDKNIMEPKAEGPYLFQNPNMYYINKILSYQLHQVDQQSLKHLIGGHKLGYDSLRKKILDRKFTYEEALAKFTCLGKMSLFTSDMKYEETKQQVTGEDTEDVLDNLWYGNWIKQYTVQQHISIIVQGHEARHAGGLIEIEWNSTDKDEITNKQMAGPYLVKSVTHQFSGKSNPPWTQKLICLKNGYFESTNTNLVKAKKMNLGKGSQPKK